MPSRIRQSAATAANQTGKPVNGSVPWPTVVSAPRTPPAAALLPAPWAVAVTPRTPPLGVAAPTAAAPTVRPVTEVEPVTDVDPFWDVWTEVCVVDCDDVLEPAHFFLLAWLFSACTSTPCG